LDLPIQRTPFEKSTYNTRVKPLPVWPKDDIPANVLLGIHLKAICVVLSPEFSRPEYFSDEQ
jgi:hypothetical protein